MYSHLTLVIASCLSLAAANAYAVPFTITDGMVDFSYNASAFDGTPDCDFRVPIPTSHLFEQGFWYRIEGALSETFFPVPNTEFPSGNGATLIWNNVNGQGFAASSLTFIHEVAAGAATAQIEMTITNNTGTALTLHLFHMADIDLQPTANDDSTVLLQAGHMQMTTGGSAITADYRALDTAAFLVRANGATDVGAELSNGSVTNFDNSGLPFGPGDFTGGFQWTRTIPAGGKSVFVVVIAINTPAVFNMTTCCIPGTGCVTDQIYSECIAQGATDSFGSIASCSPSPCPSACCLPGPSCQLLSQFACEGMGGTYVPNSESCADSDGDGAANACESCDDDADKFAPGACGCGVADTDADGDGKFDCVDNCPSLFNADLADGDGDGKGDACDNCPTTFNADQADADADGTGDACEAAPPPADSACGTCAQGVFPVAGLILPAWLMGWRLRRRLRRGRLLREGVGV
ncbi:MAG TPA: hypothetical protein VJZ71_10375 [Phycisphaerae bacterium]|nr:hypothetical protein [Phycisphaerae bacterium]